VRQPPRDAVRCEFRNVELPGHCSFLDSRPRASLIQAET
jgi:hypothetical protein